MLSKFRNQQRGKSVVFASGGFSLVEIVLAMGIVSFAFITLMGLLSEGLNSFHNGIATTVSSQIAQQVINSAQQTDFAQLAGQTAYFDDQGDQLAAANKAQAVYQVNVTVVTAPTLPGGGTPNANLATIKVQVAQCPGAIIMSNWTTPPAGIAVSTYSTQVAKN